MIFANIETERIWLNITKETLLIYNKKKHFCQREANPKMFYNLLEVIRSVIRTSPPKLSTRINTIRGSKKQTPEDVLEKRDSSKFRKIHRTPAPEPFY